MTTTECAYRSSHPDVLAQWRRIVENTWNADIAAAGRANGLDGIEGLDDAVMTWGRSSFAGFAADLLHIETAPAGWRITTKRRGQPALVPKMNTRIGKAAGFAIDALGPPPSPAGLPGMAREVWVPKGDGFSYSAQSPGAFAHAGVVYVNWGCPHELVGDANRRMAAGVPDLDMWERCKLSEYHAALEALEATKVGAPT